MNSPSFQFSGHVLVDHDIRELIAGGHLRVASTPEPASVDLPLGARAWRTGRSFLPWPRSMDSRLEDEKEVDLSHPDGVRVDVGEVLVAELDVELDLPEYVCGRGSPKSTTGRLDVFARLCTDRSSSWDVVPHGYRGKLWTEIVPQSFPIRIRSGDLLSQVRFQIGEPLLSSTDLGRVQGSRRPPCVDPSGHASIVLAERGLGSLGLSIDLRGQEKEVEPVVGWVSRRGPLPVVDLRARDLPLEVWFEPIRATSSRSVVLKKDRFYLFAAREILSISPGTCAELVVFDATRGELRTHYAGFIDPGFGWNLPDGPLGEPGGSRLVVEVRTRDVDFLVEDGQPLFRLEVLRCSRHPERAYGGATSHYQGQSLRAAKQFLV